jgi:hypothetical protein
MAIKEVLALHVGLFNGHRAQMHKRIQVTMPQNSSHKLVALTSWRVCSPGTSCWGCGPARLSDPDPCMFVNEQT